MDLGDVVLQTGCCTLLAAIAVPASAAWVLLPLGPRRGICVLSGRAAGAHDLAAYGSGAAYEIAVRDDACWGLVTLPAASVGMLLAPPRGATIHRPGTVAHVRADPAAFVRAAALLRAVAEVATNDPEVFRVEEARRSLRASVLDSLDGLLAGPLGRGGKASRWLRTPPETAALRRIVRAADDHLAAHPAEGGDPSAAATAIGVAEERLRSAFVAILGTSARRYLLTRRLVMARASLRSPGPGRRTAVAEVAAARGFGDIGGFSRLYRAMFGEVPQPH
ncbi:MAG: helix-turn-helix transcriptional regulator [Acetobacteraceae bacterium]|nr:helix-turn-helix transcriptional regulator [Acetobacteraceae bacterium]